MPRKYSQAKRSLAPTKGKSKKAAEVEEMVEEEEEDEEEVAHHATPDHSDEESESDMDPDAETTDGGEEGSEGGEEEEDEEEDEEEEVPAVVSAPRKTSKQKPTPAKPVKSNATSKSGKKGEPARTSSGKDRAKPKGTSTPKAASMKNVKPVAGQKRQGTTTIAKPTTTPKGGKKGSMAKANPQVEPSKPSAKPKTAVALKPTPKPKAAVMAKAKTKTPAPAKPAQKRAIEAPRRKPKPASALAVNRTIKTRSKTMPAAAKKQSVGVNKAIGKAKPKSKPKKGSMTLRNELAKSMAMAKLAGSGSVAGPYSVCRVSTRSAARGGIGASRSRKIVPPARLNLGDEAAASGTRKRGRNEDGDGHAKPTQPKRKRRRQVRKSGSAANKEPATQPTGDAASAQLPGAEPQPQSQPQSQPLAKVAKKKRTKPPMRNGDRLTNKEARFQYKARLSMMTNEEFAPWHGALLSTYDAVAFKGGKYYKPGTFPREWMRDLRDVAAEKGFVIEGAVPHNAHAIGDTGLRLFNVLPEMVEKGKEADYVKAGYPEAVGKRIYVEKPELASKGKGSPFAMWKEDFIVGTSWRALIKTMQQDAKADADKMVTSDAPVEENASASERAQPDEDAPTGEEQLLEPVVPPMTEVAAN